MHAYASHPDGSFLYSSLAPRRITLRHVLSGSLEQYTLCTYMYEALRSTRRCGRIQNSYSHCIHVSHRRHPFTNSHQSRVSPTHTRTHTMLPLLLIIAIFAALLLTYSFIFHHHPPLLLPRQRIKNDLRRQIPLYTFEDRPDTYEHYVKSTRQLHYGGYQKYIRHERPYRVKTSAGGERIILPFKYLAEIKNASQKVMSLPDEMEDLLLMRYTGVPQRT